MVRIRVHLSGEPRTPPPGLKTKGINPGGKVAVARSRRAGHHSRPPILANLSNLTDVVVEAYPRWSPASVLIHIAITQPIFDRVGIDATADEPCCHEGPKMANIAP
jgi:hypothetical protein